MEGLKCVKRIRGQLKKNCRKWIRQNKKMKEEKFFIKREIPLFFIDIQLIL